MPKSDNNLKSVLQDTANAIRGKTGSSAPITPRDFADEIENIPSGGGEQGDVLAELAAKGLRKINTSAVRNDVIFAGNQALSEVNMPNCLFLHSVAFNNCYTLFSLDIPNCLEIPSDCFIRCSNLTSLSFPICSGINQNAFFGCMDLSYICLKTMDYYFGSNAFQSCHNLETVKADAALGIANYAFLNCSKLKSAYFPCLETISQSAFSNCKSLSAFYIFKFSSTPINLPNTNVFSNTPMANSTYLGYYGSIYVPASLVESYKSATNWAAYSDRIVAAPSEMMNEGIWPWEFVDRTDLTEIPSEKMNAKIIGKIGLLKCGISSANLSLCEYIGYQAMFNCASLREVSFPECIAIGSYAFYSCASLSSISFPKCLCIRPYAFNNCTSLSEVNFPECKYIGGNAFLECSSLEVASFPNCLFIDVNAFKGCTKLKRAFFPNCVELYSSTIDSTRVFLSCSKLEEINFDNLVTVPSKTFYSFSLLKSASFPKCVAIGEYAFAQCSSLSIANFPKCAFINSGGFNKCINLGKAFFPNCLIMESSAFYNCSYLSQVILTGKKVTKIYGNTFTYTPMSNSSYLGYYGSIYVRASLLSKYQADPVWSYYSGRIVGLTDEQIASVYQEFGYSETDL